MIGFYESHQKVIRVVFFQDVKPTAEETRSQSDYSLTIALDCESANTTTLLKSNSNCLATGRFYLSQDSSLTFIANDTQLVIRAKGNDFEPICEEDKAIWANVIKEISVYGLDDEHNNYDHHRHVSAAIELCKLKELTEQELVFSFLE